MGPPFRDRPGEPGAAFFKGMNSDLSRRSIPKTRLKEKLILRVVPLFLRCTTMEYVLLSSRLPLLSCGIFLSAYGQIGLSIIFGNNLPTNPPNPKLFAVAVHSCLSKFIRWRCVFLNCPSVSRIRLTVYLHLVSIF
jgi:hypothetical protein